MTVEKYLIIIMDKKALEMSLSKLYKASESKRNTAYDALSEEFEDDFSRLIKEMIENVNLINPARANKYRLKELVIEYGHKCESIEDLKICLNKLKALENCDELPKQKARRGLDVVDCGCEVSPDEI